MNFYSIQEMYEIIQPPANPDYEPPPEKLMVSVLIYILAVWVEENFHLPWSAPKAPAAAVGKIFRRLTFWCTLNFPTGSDDPVFSTGKRGPTNLVCHLVLISLRAANFTLKKFRKLLHVRKLLLHSSRASNNHDKPRNPCLPQNLDLIIPDWDVCIKVAILVRWK